jgi:hypothetical protein
MTEITPKANTFKEELGRFNVRNLARSGARIVGGTALTVLGISIALEPNFNEFISDEGTGSPIARIIAGAGMVVAGMALVLSPEKEPRDQ